MKIMSEKAGFYENLWKSLWFHFMQTDHNLCQNLCLDQFLTFTIWGTKVESPPKWYKRLKCHFISAYVNEQKFMLNLFELFYNIAWPITGIVWN